ncbi:hypothetical protein PV327_008675 [Microctonus hyperodae]|uniref:Centromere protein L n=1 Tax=Microctonus hyperodae TaxID=165561 RepID=A0AA39F3L6_MICHY|nr:hypothetical protein PV327_008675 [Microctonus hyperodae]
MDNSIYTRMRASNHYIREHFNLLPLTNSESDENDCANDSLQTLIKQTWNIYGISSMFGFDYNNERQLKLYGKRLREEVASILPQDNVTYDVNFTIDEDITFKPTVTDSPAIRIEILAKAVDKKTNEKYIYTGILLSWRTEIAELDHDKSVKLPLLLCRGTKSTISAVHLTLSNMFDCLIVALPATEDDFKWLVPIILQPNNNDEASTPKGQAKFEYKFPGSLASNTITVKYDISVLAELWSCIRDNDADTTDNGISLKHVEQFHQVLQHQMLHGAGMQLGLGLLSRIALPSLTIMENRMKASTSEVLNKVLLYFNEKSIEVLHKLNLDSTVGTNSVAS